MLITKTGTFVKVQLIFS